LPKILDNPAYVLQADFSGFVRKIGDFFYLPHDVFYGRTAKEQNKGLSEWKMRHESSSVCAQNGQYYRYFSNTFY
jgi:hypothetical protein